MTIDFLRRDIRFGIRMLMRHRTVTVIAILSLGTSLAASVVGLSIYHTLLFKVPDARDRDRLTAVYTGELTGDQYGNVSYPDYVFLRDHNRVYAELAALPYSVFGVGLRYAGRNEMAMASLVTGNYFDMLEVRPVLGRGFRKDEDESGTPVVVLHHALWTRLGADASIVDKTISLNQNEYTVIGVAPPRFMGTMFGVVPDLWLPIGRQPDVIRQREGLLKRREHRWLALLGRLRPGVTIDEAQADVSSLATEIARTWPATNKDRTATVRPARLLPASMQPLAATVGSAFLAVMLLVLTVAASNVAILLIGLTAARANELLLRATLGATRWQLTRQLVTESLVVALAGGVLGYGLAGWGLTLLSEQRITAGLPIPIVLDFRPNITIFLSTLGLVTLVGVFAGLLPAWQASTLSPTTLVRGEGGTAGRRSRLRHALVGVQATFCVLVLVAAGLAVRSLENMVQGDYGFRAKNLTVATLDYTLNNYPRERVRDFERQVIEKVGAIPGMQSVSLALGMPLGGAAWDSDEVRIPGYAAPDKRRIRVAYSVVDEHYLSTLEIPLRAGRNFELRDTERSQEVVLINERMAELFWPRQQVIGQQFRIVNGNRIVEIIGIVGNGKYSDLDEAPRPFMYFTTRQHHQQYINLIARTAGPPERVLPEIERAIARVDERFVFQTRTLNDVMRTSLLMPIVTLSALSVFGGLALILATAGLYAVIIHAAGQRRQEIGVRLALGAAPQALVWLLLRQGLILVVIGIVLGTAVSLALGPVLSPLFYQVRAVEPQVLFAVSAIIFGVATLASCVAIWPSIRLDPMRLLRHS